MDAVAMAGHIDKAMDDIRSRRTRLVILDPPSRSFKQPSDHLRTDAKPDGIDRLRGKAKGQVRQETSVALRAIEISAA